MKCLLAFALVLAVPAFGQSADRLYVEGKYDAAVRAAVSENSAHGFSGAARATLAEEATREERCLACLERAEEFARKAIAADPKYSEGYVFLAITLGLESRIEGYDVARRKGYAGQAKRALETALANDPGNVWALAGLGGWNIEVARGGGPVLALLLYGATVERGRACFAEAFRMAPDNIAIRYQYGLTLAGYDGERYRGEIEDAFSRVAKGQADSAYGRLLQKRAGELLALLRRGDSAAFAERVRTYEGYVTTPAG
ncbi:MAG TPA: hypothetical protein VMU01_01840 [Rhizomicrobium sp.]|nr:hypothetical protein [Rhizomicrobium sp.]